MFVVQSTVTTARHYSRSERGLILRELIKDMGIPTLVGNTVGFEASLELMEEGIAGIVGGRWTGRRLYLARGARDWRSAGVGDD